MTLWWHASLHAGLLIQYSIQNLATGKKHMTGLSLSTKTVKLIQIIMTNYIRYLTTLIFLHLLSVHFCFISVLVLQPQGKSVFSFVPISSVYNICSINDIIFLKCTLSSFLLLLCHLTHTQFHVFLNGTVFLWKCSIL